MLNLNCFTTKIINRNKLNALLWGKVKDEVMELCGYAVMELCGYGVME
ncbi:hypothetical protein P278_06480 [Zhouia amylolytica AD3]|uniref:Uncharacterized protein n=1 Tax=Zhouia amylolytica AD3 TaxID=1286632 RepID=W2UQX9_9FLAO|nr:hypothetical protein P278_06480 [Zhouia amylolytica AD3]